MHDCKKNEEFKNMEKALREERKSIESKKRELDLALTNLNTKVE